MSKWPLFVATFALVIFSTAYVFPKAYRVPIALTYYTLLRHIGTGDEKCLQLISDYGIQYYEPRRPQWEEKTGCFLTQGMIIPDSQTSFVFFEPIYPVGQVTVSCPLIKALLEFEEESLQPLAQLHFKLPLLRIFHKGSYLCRKQKNSLILSEHSYGLAIDLSGFMLADGTEFSVSDYGKVDSPYFAFLHEVAQAACNKFGTVLTPAFNDDHKDHFHISIGLFGKCAL